jgi:processive 1,2-diacylglycerol beta-glucosyltransferase
MKKILIIYASAGAGHQRAAEAVYFGLIKHTKHKVALVDALDYTSPHFKNLYKGMYFFLISKLPWVWGAVFALLNIDGLQPVVRFFRRIYNFLNTQRLEHFLKEQNFDWIISTHFMPNEVASALKSKGLIHSKICSVVTDFDVHRIWLGSHVDYYTVACDWTKEKMKLLKIDESKVFALGIPIEEKFGQHPDREDLRRKIGMKPEMFTVLMATGSFGIGPMEQMLEALKGFQVIIICGQNKNLFIKLTQKHDDNIRAYSYVNNMHEIMAASDVLLTKPGGLSIAEALTTQLPLIFFNPIPGQETNNMKVLKEYGIGIKPQSIQETVEEVRRLRDSRDYFMTAVKKTAALAKPMAVKDIITLIENHS